MPFKNICFMAIGTALLCGTIATQAAAFDARTVHPLPPGKCAVERVSRNYLKQMCTYDDMSALATIALADELQFSVIWQQADDIMRAARHLDSEASLNHPVVRPRPDMHKGSAESAGSNLPTISSESAMLQVGGCVREMKALDEKWIEIVKATCSENVNEALKTKLAHLYVPGPMNNVQGAKIRRRQMPDEGMPIKMRHTGGLSYVKEIERLKDRICQPYVAAGFLEICGVPLPDGYAQLCAGGRVNEDVLEDFWARRQETMVQNIADKARELASQKGESVRRSRIYRLDIEGIEAAQNGLVDIEVCPQKTELIDMIAVALKGGVVRKTQSGLIWDTSAVNSIKNAK